MLADFSIEIGAGRLKADIHLPGAARYALLDFIAEELPCWRDHPERRPETAETVLTDQLCSHLNSAARISAGWSRIQFRTEVPDEVKRGRAIDLVAKPCGVTLIIEGRRHTQFDSLLPIECKRLPTPREGNRDEREYVVTNPGTTGGIQRFKFGHHAAAHQVGAMIAYVQEDAFSHWLVRINGWIQSLAAETGSAWNTRESLVIIKEDSDRGLCTLRSCHRREGNREKCKLRHLWLKMN